MDARSWKWTDAHFCSLPSQTNIYGCSKIIGSGMTKKLLVASLVGKFYTIEYQRIFDKLTPSTKEVQFTYIPGEAEIVSVDAFTGNGLIIGITFWKGLHCLRQIQLCSRNIKGSLVDLFRFQDEYGEELRCPNTEEKPFDMQLNNGVLIPYANSKGPSGSACTRAFAVHIWRVVGFPAVDLGYVVILQIEDINESKPCKQFFNIYSASQLGEEFNLESVAQGCQSLELQFIPYHLTHTQIFTDEGEETVFLLCGSDNKVHLYREMNDLHSFKEEDSDSYFPELADRTSCVIWLDIVYVDNSKRRVIVCGHQNGIVTMSVVDVLTSEVLKTYSVDHDSPVTYVKVFSLTNRAIRPSFVALNPDQSSITDVSNPPELHLLVLSGLLPATVYRNILTSGMSDPVYLPESNRYDTILCGCIIDVDFDGENEILIGTYGQEILVYKLSSNSKTASHTDEVINAEADSNVSKLRHRSGEANMSTTPRKDLKIPSRRVKSQENLSSSLTTDASFMPLSSSKDTLLSDSKSSVSRDSDISSDCSLVWQRSFAYPVIGMNRLDIMDDGMEDFIVVTLKGIHILQPDMNEVASVCLERLRLLASNCSDTQCHEEVEEKKDSFYLHDGHSTSSPPRNGDIHS